VPNFTPKMLDDRNAQHAKEFANCDRAETLALFKKGTAGVATVVRGLSDDQLATKGTVFTGMPPMSAEDLIKRALLGHLDEHIGSIRKTIGA